MQPSTTPITVTDNTDCLDCGAPLDPGRKLRCNLCIEAARLAVEDAAGKTVLPSDVARIRERLARSEG
jgi:hypothetical protein